MAWTDGELLGFDTETTGVDPQSDRIVTVALVHRDASGTRARTWLVDPGVEIPEAATAVHGISTEYARAFGARPAEALDEVATELAKAFSAGTPVVAFNACYDLTLVEAELRRHGLPTVAERTGAPLRPVVDPLVLDRTYDRYRKGKRTLGVLCELYGVVPAEGGLHSAEVDVVATLDVLEALVRRYPRIAELSLEELHLSQVKSHRSWAENFNSWRASKGFAGPGAGLEWPVEPCEAIAQPAHLRVTGRALRQGRT